jgi:hypothetical protein
VFLIPSALDLGVRSGGGDLPRAIESKSRKLPEIAVLAANIARSIDSHAIVIQIGVAQYSTAMMSRLSCGCFLILWS